MYQQGRADALNIDEDSVRFTDEQKAWVKKYIIRNGKANYERGAREFAEWLVDKGILGNRCIYNGEITDYGKVYLAEWQEGAKNE